MKDLIEDVRAFHELTGQPVHTQPRFPGFERVLLRERLLQEEYHEFEVASREGDIVEIADALADIIYICIGTALEYGIPLDKVWAEVQRSNMAKAGPDGKVAKSPSGKVLKPEGWTPPDIEGIIHAQAT